MKSQRLHIRKSLAYCFLSLGAEYGNRTRLLGLGSRCTTDVLIPLIVFFFTEVTLEPIPGLEPGTYSLRMNCSTN